MSQNVINNANLKIEALFLEIYFEMNFSTKNVGKLDFWTLLANN